MIKDLQGQDSIEKRADFIVIGAGTCGLPTSVLLSKGTKNNVVCLESGGYNQEIDTHPLNEVVNVGTEYGGASRGRFRCIGGTSTRWGGALIPFQAMDLVNAKWPVSSAELEPYIEKVEALFGLESGPYSDHQFPIDLGPNHINRVAKWPVFGKRNVYNLLQQDCQQLQNIEIYLNATATIIKIDPVTNHINVVARSPQGGTITVTAPRLIIAAGAIETTRLTLLIDRQNNGIVKNISQGLGHYFSEHISISPAEIKVKRKRDLNKIIGFRFSPSGGMRNIRFELSGNSAARTELPPSFAHIGIESDNARLTNGVSGFDALRDVFRYLQKRKLPSVDVGLALAKNLPWISQAVYWRYVQKRLLFPAHAHLSAQMVIEQVPHFDNKITLSDSMMDRYGTPMAEIDWKVKPVDIENMIRSVDLFEQTWKNSDFAHYGVWDRYSADHIFDKTAKSQGIYHPTGSTRMGSNPTEGVVDKNLKLFAYPGIQLLSTSVLPTGGGANPTMMALLLALRCVDQHLKPTTI